MNLHHFHLLGMSEVVCHHDLVPLLRLVVDARIDEEDRVIETQNKAQLDRFEGWSRVNYWDALDDDRCDGENQTFHAMAIVIWTHGNAIWSGI